MSAPLLSLEDVACQRGGLTILSGVSFALEAGEAVVLRGPNGSGKTTLLRTIAGLQPQAAGSIEGDPEDIAYTGHADGVKATLSVRENLEFWVGVFGRSEIDGALTDFDLENLYHRPAGALSAGQRRRLSLARLAVAGRRIWLLDEPTVSLDATSVQRFGAAVSAHLDEGGAAIIATHIDLGLPSERTLDIGQFKAGAGIAEPHEAFL